MKLECNGNVKVLMASRLLVEAPVPGLLPRRKKTVAAATVQPTAFEGRKRELFHCLQSSQLVNKSQYESYLTKLPESIKGGKIT